MGRDGYMHITAVSYVESSARETGVAAEIDVTRKTSKYSNLSTQRAFYPVTAETHEPLSEDEGRLCDLGRCMSTSSGHSFVSFSARFCCRAAVWFGSVA